MNVPSKLRDEAINFCLVEKPIQGDSKSGKIPFQKEWTSLEIKWDDPRLTDWLRIGGNYGVIGGGKKNLVILDFDEEELQKEIVPKLPETFTVRAGGGLLHKYFFTDGGKSFKILDAEGNTRADVQSKGKQVVGPGSKHYSGNTYELASNVPIATIKFEKIRELLMPHHLFVKNNNANSKSITPQQKKIFNSSDDFQNDLFNSVTFESLLSEFGVDTSKNPSNCPFHDSKGGRCLGFDEEKAHCFHCIHPEQEIFTINGLKKAKDINTEDVTINALGQRVKFSRIHKHKNNPKNKILKIFSKVNREPLMVTQNHGMFYYKNVTCDAKYYRGHTLCKENCSRSCNRFKKKNWKITDKINAENITTSDAMFFPIDKYQKDISELDIYPYIKKYTSGPKNNRIRKIPLSENMLWVIGMYLAEGSSFRGGIKFSLSREEENYANKIIKTFEETIGVSGSKFYQTTSSGKSLIVTISKTDLEHSFKKLFGRGCQNKKIPRQLLDLPPKKLNYLLRGVLDGDGSERDDTLGQTSKQLNMDCFEIALKIGRYPTTSKHSLKNKKPVYKLYPSKYQVARGTIGNNYLSIIKDIQQEEYSGDVIDLTVAGPHPSLLTPQGIIGNCEGAWNKMSWIKANKGCDSKEAIEWLSEREGRTEELEASREKWIMDKTREEMAQFAKTFTGDEDAKVEDFKEKKINWTDEKISWDDMKETVRKIIKDSGKMFMVCNKNDTISGKPQLIHTTKQKITLVRLTEKDIGKNGQKELIQKLKFLDEAVDKRADGVVVNSWYEKFWTYRLISDNEEYYLLSKKEMPLQSCLVTGMKMDINDFSEMNQSLKVKSLATLFFVHDFEPAVKVIPREELVKFTKRNKITEQAWFDFLDYHQIHSRNRFPYMSNILRSAHILSGKKDEWPLHVGVIGPAGTRKSMGYVETIAWKFDEDPSIIEGGNSRIKGLSPSFKEKPANIGYLAKCERMGFIDELGKMIEFESNRHDGQVSNVLGELNFLLDHKKRTVGSGNDNQCVVQASAKFLFVSNPVRKKRYLRDHIGTVDPTTMSRILWWVQDKDEQDFVMSKEGVERIKDIQILKDIQSDGDVPNSKKSVFPVKDIQTPKDIQKTVKDIQKGEIPPSPENYKGGIARCVNTKTQVHTSYKCRGECVFTREEYLTLFDSINSFLCEIDENEIERLAQLVTDMAEGKMQDIWKPRGPHHVELIIDGFIKHRCLFKDYDPSFKSKPEDYFLAEKFLIEMVSRWDTDLSMEKQW